MSNNDRVKRANVDGVSQLRYDLIDHSNLGGDAWSRAAEKEQGKESERTPIVLSLHQCKQE